MLSKPKKNIILLGIILIVIVAILSVLVFKFKIFQGNKDSNNKSLHSIDKITNTIDNKSIKETPPKDENHQVKNNQTNKDKKADYIKKYKEADDRSRAAYNQEFLEQINTPQIDTTNTYRIYNNKCSVSYNHGKSWIDVPIALEDLCYVMDGNSYYNKLQNGSFTINPTKTIFTYGGTQKKPLSIIVSINKGKSWRKIVVDKNHKYKLSGRLKFVRFVSKTTGFIILTTERVMSTEAKAIFKTTNNGDSWSEVKIESNINSGRLYNATFINGKLGFLSMICGEKPSLYKTDNGGKTWSIIELPIKNYYIQPEIPYIENGKLYLKLSEEAYTESSKKALYISTDNGNSFKFTKEIAN